MLDNFEDQSQCVERSAKNLKTLISSNGLKKHAGFRHINAELLDDLMSREDFAPLSFKASKLQKAA